MAENVVTYETFRKFQRFEKDNDALQKLPDDFYASCREWMRRKESLFETSRDQTIMREIENVMTIIKDIMDRRESKLVKLAMHHVRSGAAPQNLLPSERDCFDAIVAELERSRKAILERIKAPADAKADPKAPVVEAKTHTKLQFLMPLEPFVGVDGKVYGPVGQGESLEVPSEMAQMLVEKKMAAVV